MAQKNRLTCGDFGGRNAKGDPCGVTSVDGPCARHAVAVQQLAAHVINTDYQHMVPPFQRTKDKVCIVGFTDHRSVALELDRDEYEIWGLNELYRYMPIAAFDRWFEIHDREYLEKDAEGRQHMEDLKSFSIPVYMQIVHEDIPASVRFPKDELCETLESRYWTNCPAWMLGMAIAMGFKEIAMVGVDMAQDTEYAVQRPCCEHWLGFARGKGIVTWVPEMSDLMKGVGLYGYKDEGSLLYLKLDTRLAWLHDEDNRRLAMLRKLEADYQGKKTDMEHKAAMLEGAITELRTHRKTAKRDERISSLEETLGKGRSTLVEMKREYEVKHQRLRDERNQLVGSIQNTNYVMRSWLVKADNPKGGNSPSQATRAADERTGIKAPSDDTVGVVTPDQVLAV